MNGNEWQILLGRQKISESMYSRMQNIEGGGMVWGAISSMWTMDLQVMNGRYNGNWYIGILAFWKQGIGDAHKSSFSSKYGATIHIAKSSMENFEAMGIEILPWPARSPYLNPIESVWGWISNEIYKEGREPVQYYK